MTTDTERPIDLTAAQQRRDRVGSTATKPEPEPGPPGDGGWTGDANGNLPPRPPRPPRSRRRPDRPPWWQDLTVYGIILILCFVCVQIGRIWHRSGDPDATWDNDPLLG